MDREPLLTRALALVFAANLLQATSFNLFLNLPGFLDDLEATKTEIGVIWGITALAAIVARPPVGRVMDERGRRVVFLLGGALNVVVCLLYVTVESVGPWVAAIRVVHGLSEAMLFSALFTHATDLIPVSRRTEGIALFGISGLLPISIGASLGEWIEKLAGYDAMFAVAAVLALGSLLLSLPLRDQPLDPDAEPPQGFAAAVRQSDLVPLWVVTTVFATALSVAFTFMKTFVEDVGFGSVSAFFNAYALSGVLLRLLFASLPGRVGPKRVLFPAIGLLVGGFVSLATATSDTHVIVAGTLCGLGHGFTFPILMGFTVSRASDADRGAAMAIFTALFDLGMLLGGPTFGGVIDFYGYSPAFGAAAVLLVFGALLFSVWDWGRDG